MTESKSSGPSREDKKLPFLYLITNRKLCHPKPLEEVISEALDSGIRFIQLREKDLNSRDLHVLAGKIKPLTDKFKAILLINGNVDVALAVDADGVHLPEASMPVAEVRKRLGKNKLIGKSAHLPLSLSDDDYNYIDFVTLSPVFNPDKKDYNPETIGIERLKKIVTGLPVPVYALGGIKPNQIVKLKRVGVSGIAVSSGIMKVPDTKNKVEEYLKVF
ncbi:MAG TPA: thiamine phosphate synthase [Nitrospinota bacterium]|nr:thiamine phosphate synthase [Nitrospinota bacterium]